MSEYFRLKACLRHPWAGSNEHSRVLDHSIFKSLLVPYSENFTTRPSSRLVAIFIFLVIIIQIFDNFDIFWQLLTLLTIFDIFWQSWPFLPFWQFWQFPTMYTIFGNSNPQVLICCVLFLIEISINTLNSVVFLQTLKCWSAVCYLS